MAQSYLTHLECGACGSTYPADRLWNLCPACARPLLARYDLVAAATSMTPDTIAQRQSTLWRYREVLPVVRRRGDDIVWAKAGLRWSTRNGWAIT